MSERKKVVIIGAGFGGLSAAKTLGGSKLVEITLIDRRNHHLFQPLLYQVALAGLSPAEIAAPTRQLLSKYRNVDVLLGHVENVNLTENYVMLGSRKFSFDYLIMSCGASHSYFGKDEWENFAPGIKTLEQATEIRRRILLAFEMAEAEQNKAKQKKLLTFVVVGGGPTGVELAGAIAEISRKTLVRDFHTIDPSRTRVILIEAGQRILPSFPEELSQHAARDLEKMGVSVWTDSLVTNIDQNGVSVGSDFVAAENVIWAAGVKPAGIGEAIPSKKDPSGRVIVNEYLNPEGFEHVFIIGDQAHAPGEDGRPLPGLAPVALQQGKYVGRAILKSIQGKPKTSFRYQDKGMMATIGRKRAVVSIGKIQFSGTLAWFAWLLIHIYYLIGFRNKIFVLMNWAWSYFTYKKSARLILSKDWREKF